MSQTKAQLLDGKSATIQFTGGSASVPSVSFTGDTNTGIYSPGADQVAVSTGGSGRLFVDASGRVGVGTSSPSVKLEVSDVTSSNPEIRVVDGTVNTQWYASDTGVCIFGTFSNHPQVFRTNGIERLRIDASGRLLVGTSSGSYKFQINALGSAGFAFDDTAAAIAGTFGTGGNLTLRAQVVSSVGGGEIYLGGSTRGDSNINSIVLSTSNTERMRISNNGQITHSLNGTTNAANLTLNVGGAGDPGNTGWITPRIDFTGSSLASAGTTFIGATGGLGGRSLVFATGSDGAGSERVRIDSSGRLLVGTSSARSGVFFNGDALAPTIQLEGTTSSTCYSATRVSDGGGDAVFVFAKARGATVGSTTVVQNGDGLGTITFQGADGSEFVEAARISAAVDGTPGANDMPGRLVFSTTEDGASSLTERMRINNAGDITLGLTGTTFIATLLGADVPRFEFYNSNTQTMTFGYRGPSAPATTNTAELRVIANSPLIFSTNNTARMTIEAGGSVSIVGALSKGSGSFRIDHPLPEKKDTHQLVHSFIEGPQADLIYRGHVCLKDGKAEINIDQVSRMTEGTFEALCRDVCCFTTNETDWTPVRGSVTGNILTIEAQDPTSTADICWMVIGERKDKHMYDTDWTDENGKVITEPMKEVTIPEAA